MSRKIGGIRASGRVRKLANVNGKRDHLMLQCMASGQSGNDHAQTPPKAESLRIPVFWHHIPQTWVSSFFFFPFYITCDYMRSFLHMRKPASEIHCDTLTNSSLQEKKKEKHWLPSDLKHDVFFQAGVFLTKLF